VIGRAVSLPSIVRPMDASLERGVTLSPSTGKDFDRISEIGLGLCDHTPAKGDGVPEELHPDVRIGHVHLKVSDIERSEAFYRDVLGFEVMARYDVDPVTLARANDLRSPQDLRPGRLLFIPERVPEEALARLAKVREIENTYIWPVHGRITSYFGRRSIWIGGSNFHPALDIAAPTGTAVVAARAGTVSFAGWSNQGYGYLVILRHAGGAETWYAHNSHLLVSAGQHVEQGTPIARVGSTGFSTGPHLHFEVRVNGSAVDPLGYL
jgi:catechol 2,3-dioxygenase-like lactoylglutathione lyase family enzyme